MPATFVRTDNWLMVRGTGVLAVLFVVMLDVTYGLTGWTGDRGRGRPAGLSDQDRTQVVTGAGLLTPGLVLRRR